MEISVRKYRKEDWNAICTVHDRSRPDELKGSFDPAAFVPLADDPEGKYIADCDMYVAEVDSKVIAFAGVDAPYFAWLYVDPEFYRKGIGRLLVRHCLPLLGEDAWAYACGNNEPALTLYLSEGFVIESRFRGKNAGYEGDTVRIALNPEKEGWKKPNESDDATTDQGAGSL